MERIYYFQKCATVVSWNKFKLMLGLSINQEWATRQVYSSNDFVRDTLVEDV